LLLQGINALLHLFPCDWRRRHHDGPAVDGRRITLAGTVRHRRKIKPRGELKTTKHLEMLMTNLKSIRQNAEVRMRRPCGALEYANCTDDTLLHRYKTQILHNINIPEVLEIISSSLIDGRQQRSGGEHQVFGELLMENTVKKWVITNKTKYE